MGKLQFINIPIPAFDALDEWFDPEPAANHAVR